MYIRVFLHILIYIYKYIYAYVNVNVYVYAYVYACVYIYNLSIYLSIYLSIPWFRRYGLDLLVTGHRHDQELWSPNRWPWGKPMGKTHGKPMGKPWGNEQNRIEWGCNGDRMEQWWLYFGRWRRFTVW